MKTGRKLTRANEEAIDFFEKLANGTRGTEWDVFGPIPSQFLETEQQWTTLMNSLTKHFRADKGNSIIDLACLPPAKASRIRAAAEQLANETGKIVEFLEDTIQ